MALSSQCDKISTKKELHDSTSRGTNDGNRLHRNGPEETLRVPEGSERGRARAGHEKIDRTG